MRRGMLRALDIKAASVGGTSDGPARVSSVAETEGTVERPIIFLRRNFKNGSVISQASEADGQRLGKCRSFAHLRPCI